MFSKRSWLPITRVRQAGKDFVGGVPGMADICVQSNVKGSCNKWVAHHDDFVIT